MLFFRRPRDVAHHQKLLAMYRAMLAEFLRQRKMWDGAEIPSYLVTGVVVVRGHIRDEKGTLRAWKVKVADHPNDEDPHDQRDVDILHQRQLLDIYRSNLQLYRKQYEHYGEHQAPAHIVRSLAHARDEIGRIKAILRGWDVAVEDMAGEDEEP